jgi:rhodanese-related sulfurtransferase
MEVSLTRRKSIANGLVYIFVAALASVVSISQDKGLDPKGQIDYPRITCEELKKLIDAKATQDIVIVDNQPAESFDEGHIPGAVSFPWTDQIKPPVKLPRNKTLIMYCPCMEEEDSIDMANKLKQFGYNNFKLLKGGWFRWEELKYPIVKK